MAASIRLFSTSTAIALVMAGAAYSADFNQKFEGTKPAVSGFNGKLDIGYTHFDSDLLASDFDGGYVIGSVSLPIGHSFGLQIDAGYMGLSQSNGAFDPALGGIGAHLFWRNPDAGLLGLYGHYVNVDTDTPLGGIDTFRFGVEGEVYIDQVSIEGFVGADVVDGLNFSETYLNAELRAGFYVSDNFRLTAGVVHQFDETLGKIGAEALLPIGGNRASAYANAAFGSDSTQVNVGLRFYFGEGGKSLKARHREDDPAARLLDYFAIGGVIADIAARNLGGGGGGSEEGGGGSEEGGGGSEEGGCACCT